MAKISPSNRSNAMPQSFILVCEYVLTACLEKILTGRKVFLRSVNKKTAGKKPTAYSKRKIILPVTKPESKIVRGHI